MFALEAGMNLGIRSNMMRRMGIMRLLRATTFIP